MTIHQGRHDQSGDEASFQVESGDHWRLQAAQTHVYEERVFPEQAGFAIRPNHSTSTALISAVNLWLANMDAGRLNGSVFR